MFISGCIAKYLHIFIVASTPLELKFAIDLTEHSWRLDFCLTGQAPKVLQKWNIKSTDALPVAQGNSVKSTEWDISKNLGDDNICKFLNLYYCDVC